MSERRFVLDKLEKDNAILSVQITDSVSNDNYFIMTKEVYEDDIDEIVDCLNEQQSTIKQLESDKAIAEDYANIFEMENVKLRKKLNTYKATILSFLWIMEQNGQINGKDDDFVKDLFKLIE